MEFSRQEYWSGLPFPSPGDLPNPGTESGSPALQADSSLSEPPGKPLCILRVCTNGSRHVSPVSVSHRVVSPPPESSVLCLFLLPPSLHLWKLDFLYCLHSFGFSRMSASGYPHVQSFQNGFFHLVIYASKVSPHLLTSR